MGARRGVKAPIKDSGPQVGYQLRSPLSIFQSGLHRGAFVKSSATKQELGELDEMQERGKQETMGSREVRRVLVWWSARSSFVLT